VERPVAVAGAAAVTVGLPAAKSLYKKGRHTPLFYFFTCTFGRSV
jgi:hypothetical protein